MGRKSAEDLVADIIPVIKKLREAFALKFNIHDNNDFFQADLYLRCAEIAKNPQNFAQGWIHAHTIKILNSCRIIANAIQQGRSFEKNADILGHINAICGWTQTIIAADRPVLLSSNNRESADGLIKKIKGILVKTQSAEPTLRTETQSNSDQFEGKPLSDPAFVEDAQKRLHADLKRRGIKPSFRDDEEHLR